MKSKLLFVVMVLLFDGGSGGDDNDNHIGGDCVMKRGWKPIKNGLLLLKAKIGLWTLMELNYGSLIPCSCFIKTTLLKQEEFLFF